MHRSCGNRHNGNKIRNIFAGNLGTSIIDTFKTIGKRFTYGGDTGKDQRVYYFNTKEIMGNKFGTPSPIIFEVMNKRLGFAGCEALLQANNTPVPVTARVNTLKTTRDELLLQFAQEGISAAPHPNLPNAIVFDSMKGVLQSDLLQQGLFYIQDVASQLCVEALQPKPGETVFDLCAAPGGKSMLAAQLMEDQGRLLSMDIHPHKSDLIAKNAKTYGITCLQTIPSDASKLREPLVEQADAIVCDVPCSGMGVIPLCIMVV